MNLLPVRVPGSFLAVLLLLAVPCGASAQDTDSPERARLQAELQEREAAGDDGPATRRIRDRLVRGDFRPGDRITLSVAQLPEFPEEVVVEPGPLVRLPLVGTMPLDGLLHSELEGRLTEELQRFVLEPRLTADVLLRVGVQGNIRNPGFYSIAASRGLSELIMMAGGLDSRANLDGVHVTRAGERVLEGHEAVQAITLGSALTELDIRPGDQVIIPSKDDQRWFQRIGSMGLALSGLIFSVATLVLR